MTAKDRVIVVRWSALLVTRRALLVTARRRHVAHPTAATSKTLALRKRQVTKAQQVIKNHTPVTRVSARGVAFVAGFEGGQSPDGMFRPYYDRDGGVWTIGHGETRGVGPNTRPWTKSKAQQQLRIRISRDYLPHVLKLCAEVGLVLEQHEADALASLVYNTGPGVLRRGEVMGDAIRSKNRARIADAFLRLDHAGGKRLPGLTRRRKAERAMFLND